MWRPLRSWFLRSALMAVSVACGVGPLAAQRAEAVNGMGARGASTGDTVGDDPAVRRITLAFRDVPVRDAIERLVAQSGINLVYASQALGTTRMVSCRSDNERAERLLQCIVRGAGLDYYRLSSGTFVVIARAEEAPGYASLTGLIRDASSGAPVPQARVSLAERGDVRTANLGGGFVFTQLRPGRYRLMASAIGYQARVIELVVSDSAAARTTVHLQRQAAQVAPVLVNGIVPGSGLLAQGKSRAAKDMPMVVTGPSFLQAAAPAMLGISPNSGTGELHIQGGASGEHQLRLDGIPIFDPLAIDRVYGAFSPLAIARMTVQRAGYGASVGSFTAGVVDLEHTLDNEVNAPDATEAVDRPRARSSLTVQLDPQSASARFTSRRGREAGSLATMVAVRSSLWPLYQPGVVRSALREWNMMSPVLAQRLAGAGLLGHQGSDVNNAVPIARAGSELRFVDVHAAARYGVSAFSTLSASGYLGRNRIGTEVTLAPVTDRVIDSTNAIATGEAYRWITAGGQLSYDALVGARSHASVQVRRSDHRLRYGFMIEPMTQATNVDDVPTADHNALSETALEGTFTSAVGGRWSLTATGTLAQTASLMQMGSGVLRDLRTDLAATRAAAAVDASWMLRPALWVEAGLRTTWLLPTGRAESEPRVAVRGESTSDRLGRTAWRVGAGTYRQYITQFDVATTAPNALVPAMRFWLPVDGRTPTPTAHHVAGEFVAQPGSGWEVRAEVYRKWMPEIAAFNYGVLFSRDVTLPHRLAASDFISSSRGDAWGAGLRLSRELLRRDATQPLVRTEVGYDYGVSRRTFPSRFGGTLQPTPWNEPHRFTLSGDWRPQEGTVVTLRSRAVQGRTWALRQAYYDLLGASDVGTGLPLDNPGGARRPLLFTTDLGVARTVPVGATQLDIGVSVMNALGRRNVLDYGLLRSANDMDTSPTYDQVPRFLLGRQWSLTVRVSPFAR